MKYFIKKVIFITIECLICGNIFAANTIYTFESKTDLDDNFTYICEYSNGSMTIATDQKKNGQSSLRAYMGGTGGKSNYLITKKSYSNVSNIKLYLASSDKGKTSFAIQYSTTADFSNDIHDIQPLTLFNGGLPGVASSPSNKTFYELTYDLQVPISGYLRFTFRQPSSSGKYIWMDDLTITHEEGQQTLVEVTGIALNKTSISITSGQSETLSATITPANATDKSLTWQSSNTAVATVSDGVVTAIAAGNAVITASSFNGKTASCTVTVTGGTSPTPTPTTDLKLHEPEVYESPSGYNTPLVNYNNREYELYYISRGSPDDKAVIRTIYDTDKKSTTGIISTNETKTSVESLDGWFRGNTSEQSTSNSTTKYNQFQSGYSGTWKMNEDNSFELHIKGYDQFSILAKDKKNGIKETDKRHFLIYIDNKLQPENISTSASVRDYNISADEHVIKIAVKHTEKSELYAFSLRVTNNPRVKYVSGDDKTQQVNQTRQIEPITYYIKNRAGHKLEWVGSEATGITLDQINGTDTLQLTGTANCPTGTYTYRVVALDQNNAEVDAKTGTFVVKTEVRAVTVADTTVWINEQIQKPLQFAYDALSDEDITFKWTTIPQGMTASQDKDNNLWQIAGTPTTAGVFGFTITAKDGNTINGSITVDVPSPVIISRPTVATRVKGGQNMTDIIWEIKFAKDISISNLPKGVNYSYTNNRLVITGTPATEAAYPKTYEYIVNIPPLYSGKAALTDKGEIVIIDPTAKSVLYLYKNKYDNAIYQELGKTYDITARMEADAPQAETTYGNFDVLVISEDVDADNGEVLNIVRNVKKPVLNMKNFTYTTSRLGWGFPDNGSVSNTAITVLHPAHPVFKGLNAKEWSEINILNEVTGRGLMPVSMTGCAGSIALATAPKQGTEYDSDGENETFLHEIPTIARGAKYILLPISGQSADKLTQEGKTLLKNIMSYLLSAEASVELPELRITRFTINGTDATINESTQEILLELPTETDLTSLMPQIQITGEGTIVTPASGSIVDFSDTYFGVDFIVSDYINRKIYTAYITTTTGFDGIEKEGLSLQGKILSNPLGINLNIYNIHGMLVGTTNSDFSFEGLPQSLYMVVSENSTLKVLIR